jgi:carbonic anhydrase/acetyltransferase-like protein (isoleucine patch superfamily)
MICSLGSSEPELIGNGHFVAASATIIGNVRLMPAVSVWFNCVLRGDNDLIEVGENSNVQDGCILHTDPGIPLTIGRNVTVGHNAMLHGCTVGDNCLIGIGSIVLNGAIIGQNTIVGANSLVTEKQAFPDASLVFGSPAKVMRRLTAAEIASIAASAARYVENAARFREQLDPIDSK